MTDVLSGTQDYRAQGPQSKHNFHFLASREVKEMGGLWKAQNTPEQRGLKGEMEGSS